MKKAGGNVRAPVRCHSSRGQADEPGSARPAIAYPPAVALASSESLLKASDESSGKMHDWAFWDGWDGSWDGLGRTLGRIKCAKSSMFTGLGTVGWMNWGGEGIPRNPKLETRNPMEGPSVKMAQFNAERTGWPPRLVRVLNQAKKRVTASSVACPERAAGKNDRRSAFQSISSRLLC
jgi:hypothetical protein